MRLSNNTMLSVLILIILKSNHAANDENDACQCVPIFLCNDPTNVDYDDGNIELRSKERVVERKTEDCRSEIEVCCQPENIMLKGCGIRRFDGFDTGLSSSSYYDDAKFGEFPWTIAVLHNRRDKQDEYICNGALIHRKIVLTAANCVDGKPASKIKIRAGDWDTQMIDENLPHQDRAVEQILIHGNYSSRLFRNDIALLILSRPLKITENVDIICLPETIDELDTTKCLTSGWSRNKYDGSYDKILKKLEFKIVSRDSCQKALRQNRLKNKFVLDESFICGEDIFKKNKWKTDDGSPFICPLKNDIHRYVQIGIAVQSIGHSPRTPNIFANVLHARTWIDEQLLFYNLDNTEYQYQQYSYSNRPYGLNYYNIEKDNI